MGITQKEIAAKSDADLFDEIAQGQAWALSALYDRYSARLYGLALKILQDRSLAEDVLQDIFLNIWDNPKKFDKSRGAPVAWLMISCRNRCIDKLRSREKATQKTAILDEEKLSNISLFENPLDVIELNEMQKSIANALSQLPEEQRVTIEKAYFEGLSQSELSDVLQLPLGTIKTRMRLGMQKLRSLITKGG